MKYIIKITLGLVLCAGFVTSCKDDDEPGIDGITVDKEEITIGAEGGTEKIAVSSNTQWVTRASEPWIAISPANGIGSAVCDLAIDSTLMNTARTAQIRFSADGRESKLVTVTQFGFGKQILVREPEVKILSSDTYNKRHFEAIISTNIAFKIGSVDYFFAEEANMSDEEKEEVKGERSDWLTLPKDKDLEMDFDRGARPRTIKVDFRWGMNVAPYTRVAKINLVPVNSEDKLVDDNGNKIDAVVLTVTQEKAMKIEDNRAGDSLAIITINSKLQSMMSFDTSESMLNWDFVTLWESTDKEIKSGELPAEAIGRVRSVEFRLLNTKEVLPVEIGKIKYLETLVIYGNTNTSLLPSPYRIGNALAELKYLKNLTISALGITTIDKNELKEPCKVLRTLDVSGNNFTSIPYDLTPTNYPELLNLSLTGNRRYSSITDLSTETRDNPGLRIDASSSSFKNLLKWEKLKSLSLSYNLIYGQLPTFINSYNGSLEYGVSAYTDEDILKNDTLMSASDEVKAKLKTIPKILPNAELFSINLNFLTGDDLPDWLLYHPRFARFDPFTLIYTQDSGKDMKGNIPGFKNEPSNLEWFYERYPKARPTLTDN